MLALLTQPPLIELPKVKEIIATRHAQHFYLGFHLVTFTECIFTLLLPPLPVQISEG